VDDEGSLDKSNIQAEGNSIAIGGISIGGSVGGDIRIGHTIGFTSQQVSTLITQISTTFQPKPFDGRSPYKGLDVFEEEDAELFFGREKLVQDLVSRVKESRTVFVTGPSGSGKSSLVRAGLIHALKQGAIKEFSSERWLYATLKPGRDPFEAMAGAFSRLKSPELGDYFLQNVSRADALHKCAESTLSERTDQRLVLFIDQFEEIFTQLQKDKAQAFVELLAYAADVENGRVIILFSMRSDFIPNCVIYPKLNAVLNRQFVQIGAMQGDELVSAIAQPALRVGLRIDPDLIAQIINDMQGEPGALPLMQFALKDLFDAQQAQGGIIALTLNDYLQRGGIRKALERHADNSFNRLNGHERKLTRAIFSSLIEIGRGTVDTRRTAIFDELVPASSRSEEVEAIVRKLADARLLTTDEIGGKDTVTISHEKLIDAWPWLKRLVDENRDVIAAQNEIAKDAKEWDEHGREASYLYSGARLGIAQEQLAANKVVLSGLAKDFLEEGIALREAERKAKESLRRRIISGLVAGIAIALVLAGFAVYQMFRARDQAEIARVSELAAQSAASRTKDFSISLLLGVEAFRLDRFDSVQARSNLRDNAQTNPQLERILSGHSGRVGSVAFSPDGKTLASGNGNGTIILWDIETGQQLGQPLKEHPDSVLSLAFSPDGKTLASSSYEGGIKLWDVQSHRPIDPRLSEGAFSVAFSPDGNTLASGSISGVILWDIETGQQLGQPLSGDPGMVWSVAFSPDGRMLASGGCEMRTTNTLCSQGDVILWNVETRQPIDQPVRGQQDTVHSVAFSADGKTLASGSDDGTIILWDVTTRQQLGQPLSGHSVKVNSIAFSPDSKTLASGSDDGTIILWDVTIRQQLGQPLSGYSILAMSVAFNADGKTLASGGCELNSDTGECRQGEIILWDMETRQPIGQPLKGPIGQVTSVAFSPDGKTLASGSNKIILWDVQSHRTIDPPLSEGAFSVAFNPDGKMLASGSYDGTIILWDVKTHQRLGQPLSWHSGPVMSLAFSRDGKMLVSGSEDNPIILWDVKTHQRLGQPLSGYSGSIKSVAFSAAGKKLASGSNDRTITLWDLASRLPITWSWSGHSGWIQSVAFSADGKTLASGGDDGTIILWDVTTRQQLGQPLSGHSVMSLAFSPDSKTLASGSDDGTIILWDINPESLAANACERAGRNFTRAEWERYFSNREYRKTCEQWP
jgi:WD40 repeat protein/energy-coupling factor transporter ATP-binding protein EcfA2